MTYVALFFAGAFLCNCIPHLAAGLRGELFPSPFAKPPGKGDSAPVVNFLWGFFNFLVGASLLYWHPVVLGFNAEFGVLVLGALGMGISLAHHFGKVRKEKGRN